MSSEEHQKPSEEIEYQRLAESAAQNGTEPFRRLLDSLPAGAYTCDPDGLITYYNQRALKLWGRAPRLNDDEDRFCGSFKLYSTDGKPICHDQCWMALALRSQQGYNGQEILVERPDGERFTVLAHANPIHDDSGKLLGAVNVLVDISERKRAEDAAHQSRDVALAANRAKDHFLAVLSHELRTPLAPVVMTISAMENNPRLPVEFREDVVMMRRNIELELALIDDLLDVNRAISGKLRLHMQPVRIHEKFRHVIKNCASDISAKRLKLHTSMEAVNDAALADPARLQQVIWNLMRNATKFTPEGGDIFVRTWNSEDGQFCAEVRDTGVGIAPQALPRIFEAFEQGEDRTTQQFGGLGLGLSIARAVIEMHGGTIVASSPGKDKGASFTFTVDTISARSKPESDTLPSAPDAAAQARLRVLVVEDHVDTASMMARALKMEGHQVQTAHSVAEALRVAAAETFDVVVSDIGLPDATGYDLMTQIKERHGVKGIALSGYGMEDDLQRSNAAGFVEHLIKPVNLSELQAVLQRLAGEQSSAPN
jgi:signal transduction histidine kinase/ActR/RegA family two-component response regulator